MDRKQLPVVGYLDSRDYSRMSDPEHQTPESLEARARLMALVSAGRVALPYSWAHVAESSPDRSKQPEAALARLELMEQLADAVTFRHPAKIIALEKSDRAAVAKSARFGSWRHEPDEAYKVASNGAQDLLARVAVCTPKLAAGVMHHLYSSTAGMGRNPQSSDGGDVIHAFYAP